MNRNATKQKAPALVWEGVNYPRVSPGVYDVVGNGVVQGPVWVRSYRRWSMRIEFTLLSGEGTVSRFFNMGDDPTKPHVGRQSIYFKWWTAANGALPAKGQELTPDVFSEGQVFRVMIEDANQNSEQQSKGDAEVYSRVTELKGVTRAGHAIPESSKPESSNRESRKQAIKNQPIKFGIQVVRREVRTKRLIDRTQRFVVDGDKASEEIA